MGWSIEMCRGGRGRIIMLFIKGSGRGVLSTGKANLRCGMERRANFGIWWSALWIRMRSVRGSV